MRALVTAIAVVVFASSAAASYLQVISSFKGPYNRYPAYGVEYDGYRLWTTQSPGYIVQRHYPSGSVVSSFELEGFYLPIGMAYDGTYIYTSESWLAQHIYKIDPAGRTIVGSFPFPPGMTFCGGLAYDGNNLYFACLWYSWLWRITTNGSILSTFDMGIKLPSGLAYDDRTPGGPFIWCCNEPKERTTYVYKLTTNGSVLESAKWPIPNSNLVGLAFDGTYLWGVETPEVWNENYIYRIFYYSDAGVIPASVGRIKALYR